MKSILATTKLNCRLLGGFIGRFQLPQSEGGSTAFAGPFAGFVPTLRFGDVVVLCH